jgi:hypothetical protein
MPISSIQSSNLAPVTPLAVATPVGSRSANQEVAAAVQTLNRSGSAGTGRQFSIAIDTKTRLAIVRIIDSKTNELIEQIPSQYILDLAEQIGRETDSNPLRGGR